MTTTTLTAMPPIAEIAENVRAKAYGLRAVVRSIRSNRDKNPAMEGPEVFEVLRKAVAELADCMWIEVAVEIVPRDDWGAAWDELWVHLFRLPGLELAIRQAAVNPREPFGRGLGDACSFVLADVEEVAEAVEDWGRMYS